MGLAIRIADAGPTLTTIYCVQAYWQDRDKLVPGKFKQFRHEKDAIRAAVVLSMREAGVLVFKVQGNPDVDFWDEPVVIASHGAVPPFET